MKEKSLEECVQDETNNMLDRINGTNANIQKITDRLNLAKSINDSSEILRLEKLVELHTTHRAELNSFNIEENAKIKFDRLQSRKMNIIGK